MLLSDDLDGYPQYYQSTSTNLVYVLAHKDAPPYCSSAYPVVRNWTRSGFDTASNFLAAVRESGMPRVHPSAEWQQKKGLPC